MKRRSWFVLLVLLAASSAVAQTPPQIKPSKPAFRKLDSQLNRLLSSPVALSQEQIAREAPLSKEGRVAVSIHVEGPIEPVRALLESGDAVIANIGEDVIEAYVGLSIMPELDRTPEVTRVRVIIPPQPMVTSQGVAVHNAPNWHTNGFGGAGVRVGIIDTGFIGYSSLIGSELPAPAAVRCYTAVGVFTANIADCQTGSNHGTGVSEAVIDVAPGASLYLAQPQSFSDLLATAQWMAAQGVHVINHSVGWSWDGPGDGTSPFSNSPKVAVQAAVGGGILWVNAAGNSALGSWTGGYSDANGNRFLEFSGGVELNAVQLTAGVPIVAQARWQDSWTAANRDLDIFLKDSVGTIVAGSLEFQEGIPGDIPHEIFGYIPPVTGTYYLEINHFAGSIPSFIQLQVFSGQSLNVRTLSHSIANPSESASPGLLAVGAAAWSSTGVIEPFSSLGPTTDGRVKPDLVGADRGDSITYGSNGFAGTSQASPHVAGLVALVRQRFPTATPADVAAFLKANALPRGPANTWGTGLANLPTICNYAMSPASPTHFAGAGGGTITVTAQASCFWSASSSAPWISVPVPTSGSGSGTFTYTVQPNSSTASRVGTIVVAGQAMTVRQSGILETVRWASPSVMVPRDFDGDGKADITVYRSTSAQWFILRSTGGSMSPLFGAPGLGDTPVPADYDGDGLADIAVFRQFDGKWFIARTTAGFIEISWGVPALGDVPVPADYDGDGKADIAVYRRSTGEWFIALSAGGSVVITWGAPLFDDSPVPADYDGDGRADIGIYRGSTGEWIIAGSTAGAIVVSWGHPPSGDVPIPADYDGDGRADFAIYRLSTGHWIIAKSTEGPVTIFFGHPPSDDVPVPADYDDDGRADIAIYRATNSLWIIARSTAGGQTVSWGHTPSGDVVRGR